MIYGVCLCGCVCCVLSASFFGSLSSFNHQMLKEWGYSPSFAKTLSRREKAGGDEDEDMRRRSRKERRLVHPSFGREPYIPELFTEHSSKKAQREVPSSKLTFKPRTSRVKYSKVAV
mmetsp:Transcript_19353/g.30728  ORF Transcript_19353/g.30728 Transcript_19353/m.30728 type:complete len:117 (+) Transcript_19353:55-405(+)